MTEPPNVLVVGSINVDFTVHAERLPAPGETVVGGRLERSGGGKGANQAVAAARAGTAVALAGAVGDDELGTGALAELRAAGVDVTAVARLAGVATGVALIVVDRAGDNQIAVASGANHAVTAAHVREAPAPGGAAPAPEPAASAPGGAAPTPEPATPAPGGAAPTPEPATPAPGGAAPTPEPATPAPGGAAPAPEPAASAPGGAAPAPEPAAAARGTAPGCVLASFELLDEPVLAASRLARERGCALIVNPAPARALTPPLCELRPILTPNRQEAAELSGAADPEDAARALARLTGAPVLVTLGELGVLLADADGSARIPAPTVRALDTTGAGDAFNGVLAAELARGRALHAAATAAVAAAAESVTRVGARG